MRELRSLRHFGYPDLVHSQNVIGFQENTDDLYIHLGPNRLTVLNYQKDKPKEPYLVQANARIQAFSRVNNQLDITLQGYMPVQFTLANINSCQVSSKSPLKIKENQDVTKSYFSDEARIEIHITCYH